MRQLNRRFATALGAVAVALGVAVSAHGQDKPPPRKDLVLKGDAQCTRCHNEGDEFPVLAIGKTKHGTVADTRTPTCTSCHGQSETHVNKPADAKERPRPDRVFKRTGVTPPEAQNQACLTCHQAGGRTHWQSSMHATRDVTCASCHQVHTQHDRVRDKLDEPYVCFTCHKDQRAQINRPYRHPIREGKVTCSDCHNPHGTVGPAMVKRDTITDTCYVCHMEKRGPFVRNHPPVQENCAICHNPHGTTNAALLRQRPPYLCQECHEPTSHRGTVPGNVLGSGTGTNRAVILARGCTNCHTNIHGSNNPASTTNERAFRR